MSGSIVAQYARAANSAVVVHEDETKNNGAHRHNDDHHALKHSTYRREKRIFEVDGEPSEGSTRKQLQDFVDAPEFSPAAQSGSAPSRALPSKHPRQQKRRNKFDSASASELTRGILERLEDESYECVICMNSILKRNRIWFCRSCSIITHRSCIMSWYKSKLDSGAQWHCPGCLFVRVDDPDPDTCWCESVHDPDYRHHLPPHSCGAPCGKHRPSLVASGFTGSASSPIDALIYELNTQNSCPHLCASLCHPGTCSTCAAIGLQTTCGSGHRPVQFRCGQKIEAAALSCGEVCNKPLSCQQHLCQQLCHLGPCQPCEHLVESTCHSHALVSMQPCRSMDRMALKHSCDLSCDKLLNCGNCRCMQRCHASACDMCTKQPPTTDARVLVQDLSTRTVVERIWSHRNRLTKDDLELLRPLLHLCSCHREARTYSAAPSTSDEFMRLEQLCAANQWKLCDWSERPATCNDSQFSCAEICGRHLPCGHTCPRVCHPSDDPCGDCQTPIERRCRCGQSSFQMPCSLSVMPTCDRPCKQMLSCRSHRCQQVCCPDFGMAAAGVIHLCVATCDKPLNCQRHHCEKLCHSGKCQPCSISYPNGVRCACGMSRFRGPVSCKRLHELGYGVHEMKGSGLSVADLPSDVWQLPCTEPCTRQRDCGHACSLQCHANSCPPCPTLVLRECFSHQTVIGPLRCSSTQLSCGRLCGKPLQCQIHSCVRVCHRDDCAIEAACGQKCNVERPLCKHPCAQPCHGTEPCPETQCVELITTACVCGRKRAQSACHKVQTKRAEWQRQLDELDSKMCDAPNHADQQDWQNQASELCERLDPSDHPFPALLDCDDECRRARRNQRLYAALFGDGVQVNILPFPSVVLQKIDELQLKQALVRFERTVKQYMEKIVELRASGTLSPMMKSLHLPPATFNVRWMQHNYSSYWNLESESLDPEPRRFVRLFWRDEEGPRSPPMLMSEALELYRQQQKAAAAASSAPRPSINSMPESRLLHLHHLDRTDLTNDNCFDASSLSTSGDLNRSSVGFPVTGTQRIEVLMGSFDGFLRLHWMSKSHCLAVFGSEPARDAARAVLEQKMLASTDAPMFFFSEMTDAEINKRIDQRSQRVRGLGDAWDESKRSAPSSSPIAMTQPSSPKPVNSFAVLDQ